jgi:hypothetical protein
LVVVTVAESIEEEWRLTRSLLQKKADKKKDKKKGKDKKGKKAPKPKGGRNAPGDEGEGDEAEGDAEDAEASEDDSLSYEDFNNLIQDFSFKLLDVRDMSSEVIRERIIELEEAKSEYYE